MNKDRTVLSSADNRLSMLAMLQELPRKVNDFNPIQFSEGTGVSLLRLYAGRKYRQAGVPIAGTGFTLRN